MSKITQRSSYASFGALLLFILSQLSVRKNAALPEKDSGEEWPYYGHDAGGMRYSPLTQINRDNVAQLKVAWTFHTGDISDGHGDRKRSGFESTPLLVDGTLI
jgi:quinoprotein glucose dehydrogenase